MPSSVPILPMDVAATLLSDNLCRHARVGPHHHFSIASTDASMPQALAVQEAFLAPAAMRSL